jgi:TonB family protein
MRPSTIALLSLALAVCTAVPVLSQQPFAAARQMYASAEYEQALKALDGLRARGPETEDSAAVEWYRALCLLAMGRGAEADLAIEAIIVQDPLYRAPDDTSPRVRTAFSNVRKRILPALVQQQYNDAKTAFDNEDFMAAADGFEQVVTALNDSDLAAVAGRPPLSDLRTLAAGFRELSVKAIPPPPPPPPPAPPVNEPRRVYASEEPGVTAPVVIRQELPKFLGTVGRSGITGVVEITINELGSVDSAVMSVPTMTNYDRAVVLAATKWEYQPATFEGTPVKFRKRIQIRIAAP